MQRQIKRCQVFWQGDEVRGMSEQWRQIDTTWETHTGTGACTVGSRSLTIRQRVHINEERTPRSTRMAVS